MALPLLGIGTAALGLAQTFGGLFSGPEGEIARYSIDPTFQRAINRQEEMSKVGLTAGERKARRQGLTQARRTAQKRALDVSGGNLGRAISGGLATQNLAAENEMAFVDAHIRRKNISEFNRMAAQMQEQKNLQTKGDRERYMMQEEAASGALGAGLGNLAEFGNLMSPGLGDMVGGIGDFSAAKDAGWTGSRKEWRKAGRPMPPPDIPEGWQPTSSLNEDLNMDAYLTSVRPQQQTVED